MKNCNISRRSKMLSPWTFLRLKLTEVTSIQESCFNIQTSRSFEKLCLFSSNSIYSVQNQVIYFQYVYKTAYFHYNTDAWVHVISVTINFNRENVQTFSSKLL